MLYYVIIKIIIMLSIISNRKKINGDKRALITQTAYNDKLGEYISYTGTKVTDNKGNIKGTLIINAEVKKLISSVRRTKISQLGEMWVFDSNI